MSDTYGLDWRAMAQAASGCRVDRPLGTVEKIIGPLVEARGPEVQLGELCYLQPERTGTAQERIPVEVVGFRGEHNLLMPLAKLRGVDSRTVVIPTGSPLRVAVGPALIGRVLDGLGRPMDGGEALRCTERRRVDQDPPDPMTRPRIEEVLPLGVRAIDACLTCGRGQRTGIFSASGVGKSTLMGMIARNAQADVNVIALIGERGREVRDFIERDLSGGLENSVVVVATSSEPPLLRTRAALVAMTIAEYFRDQGRDVLFMMDSLTRFALAQREIGLAVGEQATTGGFTPSVFSLLPELLERSGTSPEGSITGIYTVLVEGDDMDEPISDAARGLLDGHIVLSRRRAQACWFPAIDVTTSVSRVATDLVDGERLAAAERMKALLAAYAESEDLIRVGAYREGSDPMVDEAVRRYEGFRAFLTQDRDGCSSWDETWSAFEEVMQ